MFRNGVICPGIRNSGKKDKICPVPDLYGLLSAGKCTDLCSDSCIGSDHGNLSACEYNKSFKWHTGESAACGSIGACVAAMSGDRFLAETGCSIFREFCCVHSKFCPDGSDILLQPHIRWYVSIYVYYHLYSVPGSVADGGNRCADFEKK